MNWKLTQKIANEPVVDEWARSGPLYSLRDLWELAEELGMTDYQRLEYRELMRAIIVAQDEKLSGIAPEGWDFTRPDDEKRLPTLDLLFEALAERGDDEGVEKIRDGKYFVRHTDGWL